MHKLIHEDWSTDETLTTDAEEETGTKGRDEASALGRTEAA